MFTTLFIHRRVTTGLRNGCADCYGAPGGFSHRVLLEVAEV